jgi:F0F1-type ATP synthase membrane subunit b/b'
MNTRALAAPIAAFALLAVATASAAPPDGAPKWDQKQVLALAEKLAGALRNAQAAAREAPPQATALQQRTRDAALSNFEEVRQATDKYLQKLRAGWDRDMTAAYFRVVRNGLRDSVRSARDAVPSEEVGRNLDEANEAVAELGRYYPDV